MPFMSIPDVYDLWEARDREHSMWLERRPKCALCENPIQQELAVHIESKWYCDKCLEDYTEVIDDEY